MAGLRLHFFYNERKNAKKIMRDYFGEIPTKSCLGKLFAAAPCSDVYVGTLNNGLYVEHYESKHLGLTGCCHLIQTENRILRLHQELHILFKRRQKCGQGKLIFDKQVAVCRKLGIDEITMFARRTELQCGYYVLPRFGFDGLIPDRFRAKMPDLVKNSEYFSQLFESEEGRFWWKMNGNTINTPLVFFC